MTEVALIGDGLVGRLLAQRLRQGGVDLAWFGAGNPTTPPVALLHRHVGRSFDARPPERDAWNAASRWAQSLSTDAARPLTMFRPTSNDSRLSRTFDGLELDHVRESHSDDFPFLRPCQRLFHYDDAWAIDLREAFGGQRDDPSLSALTGIERSDAGWTCRSRDDRVEVEHVIFATGPATMQWFDGLSLHERPGELAIIERPEDLPDDIAVSRNGHFAPSIDGEQLCVGATYRPRDAAPRPLDETVLDCLDGIARSVPSLAGQPGLSSWFGVRAVVHPDRRPLAGPTDSPGIWLAAGLASKGTLWGARTADVVARLVLGEGEGVAEIDPRRLGKVSVVERPR